MDNQKNIISSKTTISALAGMMFFGPLVKHYLDKNQFSNDEKIFVLGYIQIGYVNLIFLGIIIISLIVNILYPLELLSRISQICSYVICFITIVSFLTCINGLNMWQPNEPIMQDIPNKKEILKSYIPIYNFIVRYKQNSYEMPYRWLKESILLRTLFILATLVFGIYTGVGICIIILIRLLLILLNIDIVPLTMKKFLHSLFVCNLEEIVAYIIAPIISKIKKSDYLTTLQSEKLKYQQGQDLGLSIVLQYLGFIAILFLIYYGMDVSLFHIFTVCAIVMYIIRLVLFYKNKKKILRIPILAELISIFTH